MKNFRGVLWLAALVVAAVLSGGCSSDEPGPVVIADPPDLGPFPDSEVQLMQNFRWAYEDMNAAAVVRLLHPDYVMFLQQSTIDQFPDLGPELDVAAETRIAERMLSGVPLTNPEEEPVPGVSAISIDRLEQLGTWATSQSTDVIPETRFGLFEVGFQLERPGFPTLSVNGQLKFYVTSRDSLYDGVMTPYWQLIGLVDQTRDSKRPSTDVAWGAIKALFR